MPRHETRERPRAARRGDIGLRRADRRVNCGRGPRSRASVRRVNPQDPVGPVEVRRSRKRLRTVTAYRDGDRIVVAIPARFTRAQEREWVRRMVGRLAEQEHRRRPSDEELAVRAAELSTRYLNGQAKPVSVNWSSNQGRRWGSCTPTEGTIRISTRVRGMPRWVIDYVLLHELAHLLHAGHGPEFWAVLASYPRTERARGFLEGVTFGEERLANPDPDAVADGEPREPAPEALRDDENAADAGPDAADADADADADVADAAADMDAAADDDLMDQALPARP